MRVRVSDGQSMVSVPQKLLCDERLSFRARGLACWMWAHPSSWHCDIGHLSRFGSEGKASIDSAITELTETGWLVEVAGDLVMVVEPTGQPTLPVVPPTKRRDEARAHATELTRAWWDWHKKETGGPPTGQRFQQCVTVVAQVLTNGWSDLEVKRALVDSPVVTTNALTFARNERVKKSARGIARDERVQEADAYLAENAHLPITERPDRAVYRAADPPAMGPVYDTTAEEA